MQEPPPISKPSAVAGSGYLRVSRRLLSGWLDMCESLWNDLPLDSDAALLAARLADEIEAVLSTGGARRPRPV